MILDKYLQKLGVKSYFELTDEEKETYKKWEVSLSGRRLTDQDVEIFLKTEVEETIKKLTSQKLNDREDIFLKMKLEFIRSLQNFLNSPVLEKEMVERSIEQMMS